MSNCQIILVDDEEGILDLQRDALNSIGLDVETYTDPLAAWSRIKLGKVSLVITDWNMPGMTGMELLFKISALQLPPYVIMITAFGTVDRAVQAMNQGAYSFIEKPFDLNRYLDVVKEALARYAQGSAASAGTDTTVRRAPVSSKTGPVMQSLAMRRVFEMAHSAAGSDSSILLLGESGTGKEVISDYIHHQSQRSSGPLIKVNCGALPEHLMESELFGHEKGAFTGADRRNIGRFEQAHGGTLFLDEIGDLLLPLQVKLLRALQERTIERVGSSAAVPVNFRLICATHCDLHTAIAEKKFREDLFYRINVVPIRIPPLRNRPDDIEPLARHFLETLQSSRPDGPQDLGAEALSLLKAYSWPGNVRQLRNAVEYAMVLCHKKVICEDDLPEDVRGISNGNTEDGHAAGFENVCALPSGSESGAVEKPTDLKGSTQLAEADMIRAALQRHYWNVTAVTKELKISRSSLYERMKLYNIRRPGS